MPAAIPSEVNGVSEADDTYVDRPKKERGKLILCFDGTGNQYSGDTSDTNVVKLYQKFDREAPYQYHYYQRESAFICVSRSSGFESRTEDFPSPKLTSGVSVLHC